MKTPLQPKVSLVQNPPFGLCREVAQPLDNLHYVDCNPTLLVINSTTNVKSLNPAFMPDVLHPNHAGWDALAQCLEPQIAELMQTAAEASHKSSEHSHSKASAAKQARQGNSAQLGKQSSSSKQTRRSSNAAKGGQAKPSSSGLRHEKSALEVQYDQGMKRVRGRKVGGKLGEPARQLLATGKAAMRRGGDQVGFTGAAAYGVLWASALRLYERTPFSQGSVSINIQRVVFGAITVPHVSAEPGMYLRVHVA